MFLINNSYKYKIKQIGPWKICALYPRFTYIRDLYNRVAQYDGDLSSRL